MGPRHGAADGGGAAGAVEAVDNRSRSRARQCLLKPPQCRPKPRQCRPRPPSRPRRNPHTSRRPRKISKPLAAPRRTRRKRSCPTLPLTPTTTRSESRSSGAHVHVGSGRGMTTGMKIAVVVQRYGESINGGAELHARYVAEHLARHAEVEVLTTCARDYVTWRNELPPDGETVRGVRVRRFKVAHERDPLVFGRRSDHVFKQFHSLADELDWMNAQGPSCPDLIDHLRRHASDYDYCVFFSYRYYQAYHGVRAAGARAVLVPT